MNRSHEHVPADIEQQACAVAIQERHRAVVTTGEGQDVTATEPALDLASSVTDAIGRPASAIHRAPDAVGAPDDAVRPVGVAAAAAAAPAPPGHAPAARRVAAREAGAVTGDA